MKDKPELNEAGLKAAQEQMCELFGFYCSCSNLTGAVIKAYLAHVNDDGWLPIEEAPKDGTKVIAHTLRTRTRAGHVIGGESHTVEWQWHDEKNNRGAWHRGGGFDVFGPTHFQPLPAPPKGEK